MATLFDIDHDAGDLSEYDSTYTDGVTVEASAAAGLSSTAYGLRTEIDAVSVEGWCQVDFALATNEFRLIAYIDPNGMTIGSGDEFIWYRALDTGVPANFVDIRLGYSGGNYQLSVAVYNDAGGSVASADYSISDDEHWVELSVSRATGAATNDGSSSLWLDGLYKGEFASTLDNYDLFITVDAVRVGMVAGLDAGTTGVFFIDEIAANDDGSAFIGSIDIPSIEAQPSDIPFFLIGSPRFQARILPIVVREPIWSNNNLVDDTLGFSAEAPEITWSAFGGYWGARFSLTGRQSQVEAWLEEGLGRDVTIFNPSLSIIFEGFVNSVSANIGGLALSRGPFLDIANRVRLVYSTVDTSVTPPAVGVRKSTPWAEDTDSQTLYGIRERIISVGGISAANALLVRDTILDELKDPETDEQVNFESGDVPSVSVEIAGYGRMLETYIYNSTATGTTNVSAKLQNVLTADPNSTFSTDYTQIETNTTQVGQYEQDDRVAMSIVKGLIAYGSAANDRMLFGVYANRRARYETVPTDIKYQRSIRRAEQALEIYGTGQRVLPWNVEPGKWIFFTDLLPGKSPAADRHIDHRFSLIEEATYTAPWGLTLKGGKVNRLDQLMARLGLAGAPAL